MIIKQVSICKLTRKRTRLYIVFDVELSRTLIDEKGYEIKHPRIAVQFNLKGNIVHYDFLVGNVHHEDILMLKEEREKIMEWIQEQNIPEIIKTEQQKIKERIARLEQLQDERDELFEKRVTLRTERESLTYEEYDKRFEEIDARSKEIQKEMDKLVQGIM